MKTRNLVLIFIIMLSTQLLFSQKYEVNPQKSIIEWHGEKIGKEHEGTIMLRSGSIELRNDQLVGGNFVVDMNSITNTDLKNEGYNQKLVGHLKSDDFFGVATFPTASFILTKSSKFNNGKASVTGDITIKGKTESISFDVVKTGGEYAAKIEIDRSKFEVKYGSNSFFDNLGDKAIDNIFTVTVKLVVI